jgi:hypothetical protein
MAIECPKVKIMFVNIMIGKLKDERFRSISQLQYSDYKLAIHSRLQTKVT